MHKHAIYKPKNNNSTSSRNVIRCHISVVPTQYCTKHVLLYLGMLATQNSIPNVRHKVQSIPMPFILNSLTPDYWPQLLAIIPKSPSGSLGIHTAETLRSAQCHPNDSSAYVSKYCIGSETGH